MQTYGNTMAAGGGYGGDHKTPLPTLKFREKPTPPPSPTALRFPSDVPADKVRFNGSVKGRTVSPRPDDWMNPMAASQASIKKMIEMYEAGHSGVVIANATGYSRTTVMRHLKNQGVKIRSSKGVLNLQDIRDRLDDGESLRSVARTHGVAASTIVRWLERDEF